MCQQVLLPVNAYLTEQELKQNNEIDLKNPIARPRVPYEILFAIGGWSTGSPTSFVETYDTRCDTSSYKVISYNRNFHRNRNFRRFKNITACILDFSLLYIVY